MKYILSLILLISACTEVMTPEERGIEVNHDIIGVFNQEKAMFTAQYMVEDAYNVDLGDLALDATVYWTDTICPKNGQSKLIYRGECYFGRMWSCDEMYVSVSSVDPLKTSGTALLHGFGHCMQMKMGIPITETIEEDAKFWGTVYEAQDIARDRGW